MHYAQLPLSLIGCASFFNKQTLVVPESIEELPGKSPFEVSNLDSMTSLEIVAKSSLKPSNCSLEIKALPLSFIALHHSFVDVAILEDEH